MLISSKVSIPKIFSLFSPLSFVIIDEIHALAGCDRRAHLLCVLERFRAILSFDFQRIGLSATVGNPEEINHWMQGSSQREQEVVYPGGSTSKKQIRIFFSEPEKVPENLVRNALNKKSLFFCQSRKMAEEIGKAMSSHQLA